MIGMFEKLEETVAFVRQRTASRPTVGVILGSGLGQLVEGIVDLHAGAGRGLPGWGKSV